MNIRSISALALLAIFSMPVAASAVGVATPAPHKMKKAINSKTPGSPGYTNSSPLGSAQKADKKAKKKAAKKAM